MSTTVVYSSTADGHVYGAESGTGDAPGTTSVYLSARAGASKYAYAGYTYISVGQSYNYDGDYDDHTFVCYEGFISFNTSAIDSGDTVSAAALDLYGYTDFSYTDFTIYAYDDDWASTLDTNDYVPGANLSAKTKRASLATSGFSTTGYNTFTDIALAAGVVKGGTTVLMLASSRMESGTGPSGAEEVYVYAAEQGGAGTTQDPKLTITHGSGSSPITIDSGGGAFGWAAGGTLSEDFATSGGASFGWAAGGTLSEDFATSGGASFGWATDGTLYAQQAVWGNTFGWAPGGTIELIGNDRTISGGATFGWAPDGTAAETFITSGGATFGWAPNATLDAQTLTTELSGGATFGWAPGATLSEDFLATGASAFGWGPSATLSENFLATGASSFGWSPAGTLAETFTVSNGAVFGWSPAATAAETFVTNGGAAFGWAAGGTLEATANSYELSGGAAFGWVSEAYIEIPVAPQDEGGRGPKRGRKTPFDDWTITMDDESILELYLLGKTR